MSAQTTFLRRDPAEVEPWAETYGAIRCLIEEADGAAGEVHHVEIHDAKLHYHRCPIELHVVHLGDEIGMEFDRAAVVVHTINHVVGRLAFAEASENMDFVATAIKTSGQLRHMRSDTTNSNRMQTFPSE